VSLDPGISGQSTFNKPVDDVRNDTPKDESIYRVDGPGDLAKDQSHSDEIDHSQGHPSFYGPGDSDSRTVTLYPYRDDKPNTHNAAVDPEFVAQLYILGFKAPLHLRYQDYTTARVAATAEQILEGLNPKFVARSRQVAVALKRADRKNLRWIFSVKGNDVYAVKIRAIRPRKNTTKFSKLDLELSCSCPAWQWQGPEFHSTGGHLLPGPVPEYQLGALMGTASTPNIRDPERQNFICKHVAAVLAATRGWDIPLERKAK
jgi:hypothetical protein